MKESAFQYRSNYFLY